MKELNARKQVPKQSKRLEKSFTPKPYFVDCAKIRLYYYFVIPRQKGEIYAEHKNPKT
jgi:hypothetical protein